MGQPSHVHLDFGQVVLSSYDDDKHLELSLDHYGEAEAGAKPAEALCPLGTLARPLDADQSNDGSPEVASEVLLMTVGDDLYALPLNDPRQTASLPPLKKGGYLTYCPAAPGTFSLFDGKPDDPESTTRAGSWTVSVKYSSKAHFLQFDVRTDGKEAVSLKHGDGMGLQMVSGGKRSAVFRNAEGNAYLEANDDGLTLAGDTSIQGALGVGMIGAGDALLKATPMAAYFAALEGALKTLGQVVPPFAALKEAAETSHLKSS